MINIKVYTKNKKSGVQTSDSESSTNNINAGNAGGGGRSWLENYFIYDQARDCIICKRLLGSTNNVVAHIETDGVV